MRLCLSDKKGGAHDELAPAEDREVVEQVVDGELQPVEPRHLEPHHVLHL